MTHRSSSLVALCLALGAGLVLGGCRAGVVPPAITDDGGAPAPGDGGAPSEPDASPSQPDGGAPAPAAPFRVTASRATVVVGRNESSTLELSVERDEGFDATLALTVEGLPARVEALAPAGVSGDAATLTFTAEAIATPGDTPIVVRVASAADVVALDLHVVVPGDGGALDASFGDAGRRDLGTAARPGALAIDPAGRTLAAWAISDASGASIEVARLRRDGAADPAWAGGQGVRVRLSDDPDGARVEGIVVLEDGRVIVLGGARVGGAGHCLLIALDTMGAPAGAVIDLGAGAPAGIARAGGQLVVLGASAGEGGHPRALLEARELDALELTAWSREVDGLVAEHVLEAAGGRVVVIGQDPVLGEGVVARFLPAGHPDMTFAGGRRYVSSAGVVRLTSGALTPDGTLLVVGSETSGDVSRPFAARLDAQGALVPGFGSMAGRMRYDAITGAFTGLAVDSAGRVIATGARDAGRALIAVVTIGGALDPSFLVPSAVGSLDAVSAVAATEDRRVIIASGDAGGAALVRLWH